MQVPTDRRVGHGAPAPAATAARKLTRSCSWCYRCCLSTWLLRALTSDFWDVAWRDLAELVELVGQGSLSCCSSSSAQGATRINDNSVNVHQGALSELIPVCATAHVQTDRAHTDCKIQPRWMQSFLLCGLGPSWQDSADAAVTNVWEKQAQGLCAFAKSTGARGLLLQAGSLLPGLMTMEPAQTKSQGGNAASRAVGDPAETRLSSQPAAEDRIV